MGIFYKPPQVIDQDRIPTADLTHSIGNTSAHLAELFSGIVRRDDGNPLQLRPAANTAVDYSPGGTTRLQLTYNGATTEISFPNTTIDARVTNPSAITPLFVGAGTGGSIGFYPQTHGSRPNDVQITAPGSGNVDIDAPGGLATVRGWEFASSILTGPGVFDSRLLLDTAAASDTKAWLIYAADSPSATRAAGIAMHGIDHASFAGQLTLDAAGSGPVLIRTGNADRWSYNSSGHKLPAADLTYDIGSSTLHASTVFSGNLSRQDGNILNLTSSGAVTIASSNTDRWSVTLAGELVPVGDFVRTLGASTAHIHTMYVGHIRSASGGTLNLTSFGNLKLRSGGNNDRWEVTSTGHLLPSANLTYNLGSSTFHLNDIFATDISRQDGSSLQVTSSGGIEVRPGNTGKWFYTSTGVYRPIGDALYDIGNPSNQVRDIYAANSVTVSDLRAKKNIGSISGAAALLVVNHLRPVQFDFKEGEQDQRGFIAQEVNEVLPQAVRKDNDERWAIKQNFLLPYIVAAIQELNRRLDEYSLQ